MAVTSHLSAVLVIVLFTCWISADKPEKCPPVRPGQIGTCIHECFRDDGCGNDKRCCSNGCGRVCVGESTGQACPPVKCPLGCTIGKISPADTCDACICYGGGNTHPLPISPTTCPSLKCAFGCILLKINPNDKCETCYCLDEVTNPTPPLPILCPPVTCSPECTLRKTNPNNQCETCFCPVHSNPLPTLISAGCPSVPCPSKCVLLKANPNDRCKTCYCHQEDQTIPGLQKANPGRCPRVRPGQYGTCVHQCNFDKDCGWMRKCCSNGCGQVCVRPLAEKKNRRCPTVLPGTYGICVQQCSTDLDCPGRSAKCCSNGCGRVCV